MPTTTRRSRLGRVARVALACGVLGLALLGLGSLVTTEPRVGGFRSAEGGVAYRAAYERAMAELPPPARSVDVRTDFGMARASVWESDATAGRTPVLLLPGRSSGVPMWVENLPGIAARHPVIAVDPLGDAGLSVQSAPLTSAADQAAWLDAVVTELAPGGVHVVGHSFGGATAAAYARIHPERVRSLALLEPAFVFAYPPARVFGLATLATLPLVPESARQWALVEIGGGVPADPDDPTADLIALAARHYRAELPTPELLDDLQLASLPMPTYVAIAENDSLAGGDAAAARAGSLPNGRVVVWPGTTHSLPMEVPDALLADLEELWRR